jgi:uncharacterized membrane protein YwzB
MIYKILSWIRSYYLYFYWCFSKTHNRKALNPTQGFVATFGLLMTYPAALLLFGSDRLFPFISDTMRVELFTFRGSVNQMALIYLGISIALTYFVCCFKIRFEEIAPRLQQIPFFAQRSIPKCLLLMLINFVITIICMNLLYK